jgi:hypothetical protein
VCQREREREREREVLPCVRGEVERGTEKDQTESPADQRRTQKQSKKAQNERVDTALTK